MAGKDEVPYDVDIATAKAAGTSWDRLLALFADSMTPEEAAHLRAGSILKLLDLASWRGYEPTATDIAAAAHAIRQVRELREDNRAEALDLIGKVPPADQALPLRGFSDKLRGLLGRR